MTRPVPAPAGEPIAPGLLPLSQPPDAPLPGAPSLPSPPGRAVILGAGQRPPAGPAPRTVLSWLASDPRMTWWARRAAICVAAGTAVTMLAGWRLGITVAAVAGIADTVFRSRTTAVIPAPVRVSAAQRKTRRRLARLAPSGYLALHNRLIPGTTAAIDHLVIGPAGVFAICSQRWDRRLPVRATRSGLLFHGPFSQAGRLSQLRWQAEQAGQLIGSALGEPVTVRPAMLVYGPAIPWIVARIAGVDVFGGRRLRKYLRREAAASRAHLLEDRQAELIRAAAEQVLPLPR